MRLTIRNKLILIFLALFTLPMLISLLIFTKTSVSYAKEAAEKKNRQTTELIGTAADLAFNYVNNIGLYLSSERNITGFLLADAKAPDYSSKRQAAASSLSILPYTNEYIKGIYLEGTDGSFLRSGSGNFTFTEEEKQQLQHLKGYPSWKALPGTDQSYDIYFCRYLRDVTRFSRGLGYVKILVNMEKLEAQMDFDSKTARNVYLLEENGNIARHFSNQEIPGLTEALTTVFSNETPAQTIWLEPFHSYVTPYRLAQGWRLFAVEESTYAAEIGLYLNQARIVMAIICTCAFLLIALIFSNVITRPLKELVASMKRIENEDFEASVSIAGRDELGQVAAQFNRMSLRLKELYQTIYRQNISLKTAQLDNLMAQINPHFLYNTLDTIYWMSEFHHTADVSAMISALSKLFHLSLAGGDSDMVPLSSELEHVRCYLYIQKIRYEDNLNYDISLAVDPEEYQVLKLVLQPITENAVKHGIDQTGKGFIRINIYAKENTLIYEIQNSGKANAEEINRHLRERTPAKGSIGLKNIQDRFQLKYNSQCEITCISGENDTTFLIKMPIKKTGKD